MATSVAMVITCLFIMIVLVMLERNLMKVPSTATPRIIIWVPWATQVKGGNHINEQTQYIYHIQNKTNIKTLAS